MTDPKQKTPPGDTLRASDHPEAAANPENATPVRNNAKSPFILPDGTVLRPGRVTAVPVDAWKTFAESDFGKALLDDESIEEASEEDLAGQPIDPRADTDQEERDAATAAAAKKAGRKK